MRNKAILVVLTSTALGLVGCSSMPKAPKCPRGEYVQVNTPDCYAVIEEGPVDAPRRTSCPIKTTETRLLDSEVTP
ncbi:hypothetical protein ACFONC_03175 [Luteimonas soli]|uniref:Lipoprotein n=1 Tax=Luteimonas soli TaxID=1648966 RepID=A0ABV7XHB8_9GAMM